MTGRLLLRRPGYEVDIEEILAACATHGVAVEINANPWRLDLDWRWHDLHVPLRLIACAGLVLIMIAIGLLKAPFVQHRIVERGDDLDHSHSAIIEMSLESWFVVGIVPGINRAPLEKLEADEADVLRLLQGRGEHMVVASQRRCLRRMWTELSQAIDLTWRNCGPLETLRPKREAFMMSWWALTKEAAASW